VHVAQLSIRLRSPYVEIVEAPLPHVLRADRKQFLLGGHSALAHRLQDATRETLFDRLHDPGRIAFLRRADQEMNVIELAAECSEVSLVRAGPPLRFL
jgi:hypothetical protein